MAVGIGRSPCDLLAVIHHLHREILVLTCVAGIDALVHSLGIDEEFECRTRLAHSRHLVVFPRAEIDIAHPGLHMTRLGFHRHETAMHEAHHISDGVHRRELLLDLTFVVVEHLHGMGLVQVVADRVLVAIELLREILIHGLSLGDVLDEILDLDMSLVLPRVCRSPMVVEGLLYLLHLLVGSLFGILLHARVEGGVDLQPLGIERVTIVVVVLAPVFQIVGHSLAEVVGVAIVGRFYAVVEFDVEQFQRVALGIRQMIVLSHQVEHNVTTLQRVVGVDQGVIIGSGLEHTHEDGSILRRQILGCAAEVGFAGCLDAKGVRAEIDGVGILRQDLVLGEEELQFVGRDPLFALHDEHLQSWDIAQQTR